MSRSFLRSFSCWMLISNKVTALDNKPLLNTGKSFSEALILASTNPQYDKRLFIELRVQYMKIPNSKHVKNMLCTKNCSECQNKDKKTIFVHNMYVVDMF